MEARRRKPLLEHEQVAYLLRRMAASAADMFAVFWEVSLDHARRNNQKHDAVWRDSLAKIGLWNQMVQQSVAEEFVRHVPDAAQLALFAYQRYCKRTFGHDAMGNINELRVEVPQFYALYHAFLARLANSREMVRGSALTDGTDLDRACGDALLDALRDMAMPRVKVLRTYTPDDYRRLVGRSVSRTPSPEKPPPTDKLLPLAASQSVLLPSKASRISTSTKTRDDIDIKVEQAKPVPASKVSKAPSASLVSAATRAWSAGLLMGEDSKAASAREKLDRGHVRPDDSASQIMIRGLGGPLRQKDQSSSLPPPPLDVVEEAKEVTAARRPRRVKVVTLPEPLRNPDNISISTKKTNATTDDDDEEEY